MNKVQKDGRKVLEADGWEWIGYDGSNKLVFSHPNTPKRIHVDTTPRNSDDHLTFLKQLSRRHRKFGESGVDQFYLWLCAKYEVPETGVRRVVTNLAEDARVFVEESGVKMNASALSNSLISNRKDVWVTVTRGYRRRPGHYDLRGPRFDQLPLNKKPLVADTPPAEPEPEILGTQTEEPVLPSFPLNGHDPFDDARDLLNSLGSVLYPHVSARSEFAIEALLRVKASLEVDLAEINAAIEIMQQPIEPKIGVPK